MAENWKLGNTFPVRIMTPMELSSLASLNARISSLIVCGRKAFLLSGLFIVIWKKKSIARKDFKHFFKVEQHRGKQVINEGEV